MGEKIIGDETGILNGISTNELSKSFREKSIDLKLKSLNVKLDSFREWESKRFSQSSESNFALLLNSNQSKLANVNKWSGDSLQSVSGEMLRRNPSSFKKGGFECLTLSDTNPESVFIVKKVGKSLNGELSK